MPDFFELSTEVEVPNPIRVPTPAGDYIITPPTRRQMRELQEAPTGEAGNRALIGEHYDEIAAYYDDLPVQHWDRFIEAIGENFFGKGANSVPGKSPDSSAS